MKQIWNEGGALTEYGKRLTARAERLVEKFMRSTGAKGRDLLHVEQVINRAAAFRGTMLRLASRK